MTQFSEGQSGSFWGAGFSLLFGGLIFALALSSTRIVVASQDSLLSRNVYGAKRLPLRPIALGVRAHYSSRGGPTYTIYAIADGVELDIADSRSKERASKYKAGLSAALLSHRLDLASARAAQEVVTKRETRWREQELASKKVLDDYYSSGKARRVAIWTVVGASVLMMLIAAAVTWLGS